MWKQDKRITIGLLGMIISLILFFIIAFILNNQSGLLILLCLLSASFFIGYFFKGVKLGFIIVIALVGILLGAILVGQLGGILVDNGYISKENREFYGGLFLPSIVLIYFLWNVWKKKKSKGSPDTNEQDFIESQDDEVEIVLDGSFVILIKPNMFKVDNVYKVIKKGEFLYFCRVGGQLYEINELLFDYTVEKDDHFLISDKFNSKVRACFKNYNCIIL